MTPTRNTLRNCAKLWMTTRFPSRQQNLGKVDQGGGGTIAYILANYNMEVIDCGVAVLNMHAPWEIASKVDIYEAYRGYCAFLAAETK